MAHNPRFVSSLSHFIYVASAVIGDTCGAARVTVRSRGSLITENLFLRKQLAFYSEHQIRPARLTDAARFRLVFLSRWFHWKDAIIVVKPETLIGWHRQAFQLFWSCKSRGLGGRPRLPQDLRALISEMVRENPTWGQARVAAELTLKMGIRVSPRTVRAYWPIDLRPEPVKSQRCSTFIRNHAKEIVACDFLVVVTASFRMLYVFVAIEIESRKLLHVNATAHPTSEWTLQQLREAIPSDHSYRWLVHDRSGIFSNGLDSALEAMGVTAVRTPVAAPKASAYCERVIGSLRRELLDWFIPLSEKHLRLLVREWMARYNQARPHLSSGPGLPDSPPELPVELRSRRHVIPDGSLIKKRSVLGGLHHEYRLERVAA
jgi:putative transposase